MIKDYTVLPFTLEHYPLMKELFLSAFGTEIDFNSFLKKYDTRNLGLEVIGFLAIHTSTQEPAAYYGVFPLTASRNGETILVAQSGDTMTHKNHRKRGLFVYLAKITFDECRKKGIQFIFGLPNNNSYHGFINKLDWMHLDDVEQYDLKLRFKTLPLPKISLKLNIFSKYIKYAKSILKKGTIKQVTAFYNSLNAEKKILRSKAYIDYKTTDDKDFIRVDEIILWIKLTDVFWIGDIDNYDKVTVSTLKKLKRIAFLLGYNTIRFHINKNVKPRFLDYFKPCESEPLCYYYINKDYQNDKLIITGADFDTW